MKGTEAHLVGGEVGVGGDDFCVGSHDASAVSTSRECQQSTRRSGKGSAPRVEEVCAGEVVSASDEISQCELKRRAREQRTRTSPRTRRGERGDDLTFARRCCGVMLKPLQRDCIQTITTCNLTRHSLGWLGRRTQCPFIHSYTHWSPESSEGRRRTSPRIVLIASISLARLLLPSLTRTAL